jgi:hypothetical protein
MSKYRARIYKLLRSPEIDSKESIPPAYVAWRVGTTTVFLLSFLASIGCSKVPARIFERLWSPESIPRNEFRQPM